MISKFNFSNSILVPEFPKLIDNRRRKVSCLLELKSYLRVDSFKIFL